MFPASKNGPWKSFGLPWNELKKYFEKNKNSA